MVAAGYITMQHFMVADPFNAVFDGQARNFGDTMATMRSKVAQLSPYNTQTPINNTASIPYTQAVSEVLGAAPGEAVFVRVTP